MRRRWHGRRRGTRGERAGQRALFGGGVGNAEQVLSIGSNAGISFFETLTAQPPSPDGETVPTTSRTSRASASLAYSLDVPYAQVASVLDWFCDYELPPRAVVQ